MIIFTIHQENKNAHEQKMVYSIIFAQHIMEWIYTL